MGGRCYGAACLPVQVGSRREDAIKRCAIYTRKSSAEGLDQHINSLDAQRYFCESFVASQSGEGWIALPDRYDDGGCSGGTLDRPAIQRLLLDLAGGGIEVVIVYKIDRLSRSLIDFASLLGRFEAHGVAFVAVTQAFSTTSPVGRLTLNVLLSFAQFERELLSERLRDKAAAARAKGLWQAGGRPFGYRLDKGRLRVDEAEADIVRYAFRRYPEIRVARLLAADMVAKGMVGKSGRPYTASNLLNLLNNRLYRGDLVHRGRAIPGTHEPIISEMEWERARRALREVAAIHRPNTRPAVPNPLKGRIFLDGRPLSHTFCRNRDRVHRYYVPTGSRRYGHGGHYRAADFDAGVIGAVRDYGAMAGLDVGSDSGPVLLARFVARIDIDGELMRVRLVTGAVLRAPVAGQLDATW